MLPNLMLDNARWNEIRKQAELLRGEIGKSVVGQAEVVDFLLAALFCKGHCLIIGVPGLGKTLLVRTFGKVLGLHFNRIQFTPDLMPTDILGSEILQGAESGLRKFEFSPGPVFTNLLLADEINRTPPKTQAALLEAMQEKQVTVSGVSRSFRNHSLFMRPKTRLSMREHILFRKLNWTVFFSACMWITLISTRSGQFWQ